MCEKISLSFTANAFFVEVKTVYQTVYQNVTSLDLQRFVSSKEILSCTEIAYTVFLHLFIENNYNRCNV